MLRKKIFLDKDGKISSLPNGNNAITVKQEHLNGEKDVLSNFSQLKQDISSLKDLVIGQTEYIKNIDKKLLQLSELCSTLQVNIADIRSDNEFTTNAKNQRKNTVRQ